jgi:hypothetical protein
MPIADAAKHLGLTVEMLRKRAQRGTLPAYKVDGRWYIIVADAEDHAPVQDTPSVQDVPDSTSRPGHGAPTAVTQAAFSQLEAIRDQWLRPFVEELNAKSERIGRLEERLAAAEQERDELRRQMIEAERTHLEQGGINRKRDSLEPLGLLTEPEFETSPQTRQDAPGHADPPDRHNESNNEAVGARRGGLAGLWDWLTGR